LQAARWSQSLRCLGAAQPVTVDLNREFITGGRKMDIDSKEIYRVVLKDYPDVLNIKQVSAVLGVSTKVVYRLLHNDSIASLKIGREFRIPKVNLMRYIKVFGVPASELLTV
jgi:excisionase family DNA binding protein